MKLYVSNIVPFYTHYLTIFKEIIGYHREKNVMIFIFQVGKLRPREVK